MSPKKEKLKILFAIDSDVYISEMVNTLSSKFGVYWEKLHQEQIPSKATPENKFDFVITCIDEKNSDITPFLSLLNSVDPSIPVVLFHDTVNEINAVNLVASDAQVVACFLIGNWGELLPITMQLISHRYGDQTQSSEEDLKLDTDQYKKFVEVAREGIWVIDAENVTTYVNPAMARMFGYSATEMIGKHLFYFMDEQGVEICKRNLNRREQGIDEQHDFEFLRKDGSRIYTTLEVAPFMENGEYKGGIASVIDITDKYNTEQNLRMANRALRTTRACVKKVARASNELELLSDICTIIVDLGGYRMSWIGYAENDDFKTVRPVALSELANDYLKHTEITWSDTKTGRGPTGTAIRTCLPFCANNIATDPQYQPWREKALSFGYESSIALPLISENIAFGSLNIYSAYADAFDLEEQQLLQELADELAFGIVALRDHSARLQAEAELVKYQEHLEELVAERTAELERSNNELESFSYTVSHDLRAPLRHINGYSHLLLDEYSEKLGEEGLNYLERTQDATQRMGDLIDHILKLARLNRQHLQLEPINLSNIAMDTLRQIQEQIPDREVKIDIAKNINAVGDRKLISLVLQNLLGNAWKFTENTDQPYIEFGVIGSDDEPVYFVRDNGVGFDMHYVNKLFGTFQRLHHDHEFEGSGIGLASVQRIIERHGGQVWAEGSVGNGATFFFTLKSN